MNVVTTETTKLLITEGLIDGGGQAAMGIFVNHLASLLKADQAKTAGLGRAGFDSLTQFQNSLP